MRKLFFTIALLLWASPDLHAFVPKENTMQGKRIMYYTPHLINPKFFGFEFGFVTEKTLRESYNYNAFAKLLIAEEFFEDAEKELRAGMLGVKAGIILPTQPWFPFFLEFALGFAKTAYQKDPWFGEKEDSINNTDMFLVEGGAIYRWSERFLMRLNYQYNNVDYVTKKFFISFGVNY